MLAVWDCFKQYVCKPVFNKCAVCRMLVAHNSVIFPMAQRPDNVYPFKLFSGDYVMHLLPPQRTPLFPMQTGVYAAFVNENTFLSRHPL